MPYIISASNAKPIAVGIGIAIGVDIDIESDCDCDTDADGRCSRTRGSAGTRIPCFLSAVAGWIRRRGHSGTKGS